MPRPRKWRRVCCMPQSQSFGPMDFENQINQIIIMSVDEFETIRLIDLENLTQEECAERMGVSRTTAQAIYSGARTKLARCLVQGNQLFISGGDFVLCNGDTPGLGCNACHKKSYQENTNFGDEKDE